MKSVYRTGEKIEVVINNERKEFKRKKTDDSNSNNYVDEIEAPHSTTVASLKNWLIKNYVCTESLSKNVLEDYKAKINQEIEVIYFEFGFYLNLKGAEMIFFGFPIYFLFLLIICCLIIN